jgi:hypothetical protein
MRRDMEKVTSGFVDLQQIKHCYKVRLENKKRRLHELTSLVATWNYAAINTLNPSPDLARF